MNAIRSLQVALLTAMGLGAGACSSSDAHVVAPGRSARATPAAASRAPERPLSPRYRALRRLAPEDITKNAYGAYPWAKRALAIGDPVPSFSLPKASGGTFESTAPRQGDLLIVFYRGFW